MCRELAPGTVSLTGDWAQGDDSKHDLHYKGEVGAPLNRFKPSSKIFLLAVPRRCFFCGFFMIISALFCYAFTHVCLLMLCGHLLGKG